MLFFMVECIGLNHNGTSWMRWPRTGPLLGRTGVHPKVAFKYNLVGPTVLSCAMMGKAVGSISINCSLKEFGDFFILSSKKEFFQTLMSLVIKNLPLTFVLSLLMDDLNSFVLVPTLSSSPWQWCIYSHSVYVYKQRTYPLSVFVFIG